MEGAPGPARIPGRAVAGPFACLPCAWVDVVGTVWRGAVAPESAVWSWERRPSAAVGVAGAFLAGAVGCEIVVFDTEDARGAAAVRRVLQCHSGQAKVSRRY